MKVSWSHCVLKVRDIEAMAQFYCDAFGWEIADRGGIGEEQTAGAVIGTRHRRHRVTEVRAFREGVGGEDKAAGGGVQVATVVVVEIVARGIALFIKELGVDGDANGAVAVEVAEELNLKALEFGG